ncbi:MAG: roadblock/LC7 domain-containing protein [Myxococcales bacterium]|jgi:predicted regulator of Ras-like GTPase activity (Roadblock/LC7/MglB family)|nr:roadblock/LC7 domain-containing protein [Myxococcales bacterium]MCB9534834.1 roadblock/LC7 domain-containing protein [Myxococcales bacterium]
MNSQMVLYEEEYNLVVGICDALHRDASAKAVFLVDKNGQLLAASGETGDLDTTSLASLTAGNIAATGGLAQLLGEKEFAIQFHEGERDNVHISLVGQRVILVIIFDQRSSLGLVRLRVKKASVELAGVFETINAKAQEHGSTVFSEITDDDIDNLFGDM